MNILIQTALSDLETKRSALEKRAALGARGRMARAVAADVATPIAPNVARAVSKQNQLAGQLAAHSRDMTYDRTGAYRRNNALARLRVDLSNAKNLGADGQNRLVLKNTTLMRRTGVAPGLQNRLAGGAAAPATGAAQGQQGRAQQAIAARQGQAVKAQQAAQRQARMAPVAQVLNSDVIAAQAGVEKAQQRFQAAYANAAAGQQAAQMAQGGVQTTAVTAPVDQSTLLDMEIDPTKRRRVLMGAGLAGAAGVGVLGMRYINGKRQDQNEQ